MQNTETRKIFTGLADSLKKQALLFGNALIPITESIEQRKNEIQNEYENIRKVTYNGANKAETPTL